MLQASSPVIQLLYPYAQPISFFSITSNHLSRILSTGDRSRGRSYRHHGRQLLDQLLGQLPSVHLPRELHPHLPVIQPVLFLVHERL